MLQANLRVQKKSHSDSSKCCLISLCVAMSPAQRVGGGGNVGRCRVARFGLFEAKKQIWPFLKFGWPQNF